MTEVSDLFLKTAFDLACRAGPTLDALGESSTLVFPFIMLATMARVCLIIVLS